jgi:hypothetical protein
MRIGRPLMSKSRQGMINDHDTKDNSISKQNPFKKIFECEALLNE